MSSFSLASLLIGISRSIFSSWATCFTSLIYQVSAKKNLEKGITPPSLMERVLLKISSGSTLYRVPIPLHFSQAPKGELKENIRGSISGRDKLQLGQANFSEQRCWLNIT